MTEGRIIRPAARTIAVPGIESRRVRIPIEVEAAVSAVIGERVRIMRVRMEDGRWVSIDTFFRRLRALGVVLVADEAKVGEKGEHTPIYG